MEYFILTLDTCIICHLHVGPGAHQVQEIGLAEVGAAEALERCTGSFAFRILGSVQRLGARSAAEQVPARVGQARQLSCGPRVLLPQIPGMTNSQALRPSQRTLLPEYDR